MGDRVVPTVKYRTEGYTTRTVCEMLGWSIGKLFGHIARGELPPPDWWRDEMVWPLGYPRMVWRDGLHLPGTYPGWHPGTNVALERRRWYRGAGSRCVRYSAVKKRVAKRAAQKARRK